MEIRLNGEPHEIEPGLSIGKLVAQLELDPRKIAIEHNGEILENTNLNDIELKPGDTLEIVRFVGGG